MIAEYLTAISTSPWNNDHFYDFEASGNDNSLNYYNDLKLTSRGTSRRSSECSDRESELFCTDSWFTDYDSVVTSAESLPDITLVNSYLDDSDGYQGLESPNVSFCETDDDDDDDDRSSLNSDDEDEAEDEYDDDIYPSPKKSKRNLYDVTWSEMSKEEHIRTIEELISLISEKMNLRDQLEIIRIINPKAQVSPTANEFIIELEWLTDEKLHRIRDYITQTSKLSKSESSKEDNDEEADEKCSTKSTSSKRRKSKRSARERRQQMRAQMLRQWKDNKQAVKEKKSGLFRNEKVLSVERVQDDCEEVDILG
ncbi:protein FAM199X-B-like [Anneissia japonica]|uniref:protein FAM199X-B-like n=1 Tax=Anneissia japonica TaxID=1529436 RepID=UPI0014257386|nr:protein FAM199X-B-like [Anneissia japonica]